MSIEIIKGIEYSDMIHSIKEELSINSDFSIYIGEDCNEYYKNIGGVLYIKNGLYDSDKKIVFIRTIDEAVFVHEFTHVKFRELYSDFDGNEAVLHFISEYIAIFKEHQFIIDKNKKEKDYVYVRKIIIKEINNQISDIKEELKQNNNRTKKEYMYCIANLLARKHILLSLDEYDYKNIELEIIRGLCCFKSFDGLNIANVEEKYKNIENEYLNYIKTFNISED